MAASELGRAAQAKPISAALWLLSGKSPLLGLPGPKFRHRVKGKLLLWDSPSCLPLPESMTSFMAGLLVQP